MMSFEILNNLSKCIGTYILLILLNIPNYLYAYATNFLNFIMMDTYYAL